jgi:dUTP pyrophosphatase
MKNIYCLTGRTGSGKSTLADWLTKHHGMKQVESYTTRPKRFPDEGGHTYVTPEEFDQLGTLVAVTRFNGYRYGVPSSDIDTNDLYVVDIVGIHTLKRNYKGKKGIKVIGIDMDATACAMRMIYRGDGMDQVVSRMDFDNSVFTDSMQDECDIVLDGCQNIDILGAQAWNWIESQEDPDFSSRLPTLTGKELLIRYTEKKQEKLKITPDGDWVTLCAAETVDVKKGESKRISFGLSIQLPDGYEAHIIAQKDAFEVWKILLPEGICVRDNKQSHEIWSILVWAVEDTVIRKGDPICRFRIMKKMDPPILVEG